VSHITIKVSDGFARTGNPTQSTATFDVAELGGYEATLTHALNHLHMLRPNAQKSDTEESTATPVAKVSDAAFTGSLKA